MHESRFVTELESVTMTLSRPHSVNEFAHRRRWRWISFCVGCAVGMIVSGCGIFSGEDVEPPDPFANGVLNTTAHRAPPNSTVQFLARMADQLGWEVDVAQDLLLRESVEEEHFQEKVQPRLLGLFFKNGFSVLPRLGEGHEFTHDTLVQGDVAHSRYLVKTREKIRIIFIGMAENIVIVYPKDGKQPQVFNRNPDSTVALRASKFDRFIN